MPVAELDNFRKKYPQYGDIDDTTLANKLASKYPQAYGDLPGKVKSTETEGWEFLENHPQSQDFEGGAKSPANLEAQENLKKAQENASPSAVISKGLKSTAEQINKPSFAAGLVTDPLRTLTGKNLEDGAREEALKRAGKTDFKGMSADEISNKLSDIKDATFKKMVMAQIGDLILSPVNYIPLGKGASKVGEKIGPEIEKGLKESAESSYTKALGPTTKAEKELAGKVTPGLVEKSPVFVSRQQLLDKASKNVEKYGADIDTEWANIPKQTRINLEPVLEKIKKTQDGLKINGEIPAVNQARFNQLEKVKLDFINTMKTMNARPDFIRQYRQAMDSAIEESKQGFKMTGRGGATLKAQRTMANSIRSELAQKFPNIARLNKEFTLWTNLQELLESTAPKTKSPLSAFHAFGAEHAASVGHPFVGIFVNLSKLVSDNVLWNSISGSMKSALANSMAKGEWQQAGKIIDAMKVYAVSQAQKPKNNQQDIQPSMTYQPFKDLGNQ